MDVAAPDPRSAWLESNVKVTKTLSLRAIYIQGEVDGVNPSKAEKTVPEKFSGPLKFVQLPGIGHFPQREAPDALAGQLLTLLTGEAS